MFLPHTELMGKTIWNSSWGEMQQWWKRSLQQDRNLPFNLSSQGSPRCRLLGCAVQFLFTTLYITRFLAKFRIPYGNVLWAEPRAPDLSPVVVLPGADERCTGPNTVLMERDTVESRFCLIPVQIYFSLPCLDRVNLKATSYAIVWSSLLLKCNLGRIWKNSNKRMKHGSKLHLGLSHYPSSSCQFIDFFFFWLVLWVEDTGISAGSPCGVMKKQANSSQGGTHLNLNSWISCYESTANRHLPCQGHSSENQD